MSGREASGSIVIATAIPEEFDAIARAVPSVRTILTGDGPARAAAALFTLEGISVPATLIGAGVCGALSEDLAAGDILVSSRILDDEGDAPSPSAPLVAQAAALGAIPATFMTVARPLVSSNEKRAAAERADRSPAAVDMESAAWARAAARRGVPFVVLRAVADTFEESLPDFLADCVDGSGSIDRAAVARGLLLHPTAVGALLRMRTRVHEASARLAAFLARFLEGGLARA